MDGQVQLGEHGLVLHREPWRWSQICGEQTGYGLPWSEYCGKWKAPGKFFCAGHDADMVEEYGPEGDRNEHRTWSNIRTNGSARGLEIIASEHGWTVFDQDGNIRASADDRRELERDYGFVLAWEGDDGEAVAASEEEQETFRSA